MSNTQSSKKRGFCTFLLDNKRYAVDILTVQDVNRHLRITPVYGAPDYVLGLVNLRGQVVNAVDTKCALGLGPMEVTENTRQLVLKTNSDLQARGITDLSTSEDLIGLLVDRVSDVIDVEESQIEVPPPALAQRQGAVVHGVVQLEGEVLRILDPSKLLAFEVDAA
ncbi:MAG: chemotaxis protein CheW [Planctomycetes bacterium]|nr:chemotaxis protein CheW [Planctomycetota bacterium]